MKIFTIALLAIVLSGCSLIINRVSIQQDANKHYVEIYGGAFTTEGAFSEELSDFTKNICGTSEYDISRNNIVSATAGSLPGMTCQLQGCATHQVMKVNLICDKTSSIEISPKVEGSRWLDKEKDQDRIVELLESDRVTRELISQIGKPESIYFNGDEEIIWEYPSRNITVFFERTLALTGYRTHKMILKHGLHSQN